MDARSADTLVLSLGSDQGGVVTTGDLERLGLTQGQVTTRVGRLLTRYVSGVYFVGPAIAENFDLAAARAVPSGRLSHGSAAQLHGMQAARPASTHVISHLRSGRKLDGVRVHWTRWLPSIDCTVVRHRPTTSIERTMCDLAATTSSRRLQHIIEQAIASGETTSSKLQACVLSYRRKGRTGSRLLGMTTLLLFDESPLPMSALERKALDLLDRNGLDGWTTQFQPPWHDGIRGTVDVAWSDKRVILELDGRRWHTMTQAFEDDRRRDQRAVTAGWRTIRASWQQVIERPDELVEVLQSVLNATPKLRSASDLPGETQQI